jgi:hypothetical protein
VLLNPVLAGRGYDLPQVSVQKSNGNANYGMGEDQEVEPGMAWDQQWDLEGFFLKGKTLSMVGGFNFKTGGYDRYRDRYWGSGDIFFDVDGTPQYGTDIPNGTENGNLPVSNTFGTILLLGTGLIGLAGFGRKKFMKN